MVRERSNARAAHRRVQRRSGIGATRSTQFRLLCSFRRAGERSFKMFGGRLDVAHCCYRHGLQSMIVILDVAQKFRHSVQSGQTLLCSLTWRHRVGWRRWRASTSAAMEGSGRRGDGERRRARRWRAATGAAMERGDERGDGARRRARRWRA